MSRRRGIDHGRLKYPVDRENAISVKYVIITPSHNESLYIEKAIDSVCNQTIRPQKWVIVDDASTDDTMKVVERCRGGNSFIEVIRHERRGGRHFGNKVRAFNRGLEAVSVEDFQFIGNLDADVSFPADYFENVLKEFANDPKLGIAGGMIYSRHGDKFVSQEVAPDSVAGAVQLFRRECFEQVGGYMVLPHGGIDTAAEVTARMLGWRVKTLPKLQVLEHRRTGSATARPLAARIKEGRRMQSLGYGPLFFFLRCAYRANEHPRFFGSCAALWGYFASKFVGEPIVLTPAVVNYLRMEHLEKLKRLFRFPV